MDPTYYVFRIPSGEWGGVWNLILAAIPTGLGGATTPATTEFLATLLRSNRALTTKDLHRKASKSHSNPPSMVSESDLSSPSAHPTVSSSLILAWYCPKLLSLAITLERSLLSDNSPGSPTTSSK
ncbi:Uncharacterized protein APZ42_032434 [Daphnia magna]|uniref:Uncharacterized protein n=1 Tax=Daphnia magna TaxID=35525 RepID=A0A164M017_9CRUS|nr:Uncharacterized protein APZ42_032434 [Daphnia magna]